MLTLADRLRINDPLVTFNGGSIVRPDTLQSLYTAVMPLDEVKDAINVWGQAGVAVFAQNASATPPDIYYQVEPLWPAMQQYIAIQAHYVLRVADLATQLDFSPVRLMIGDNEVNTKVAQNLVTSLVDPGQVRILRTNDYDGTWYLELVSAQATKANGLRFLCDYYSIDPSEIIAVGDHINDLDMIEFAGLGVAMGNAQPQVKAKAQLVIGDHDHDGLAEFIEKELLR
jgi:hydroxymethylpyrimidine pyrophosphatase-like HAD family hydrolase